MDWYPHYINDYDRDTLHLSTLEHGAYRLLIDAYMRYERPIPSDDQWLARTARLSLDEWLVIAPRIKAFFTVTRDVTVMSQLRCEKELKRQAVIKLRNAKRQQDFRDKLLKSNDPVTRDVTRDVTVTSQHTLHNNIKKREVKNGSSERSGSRDPDNEIKAWARTIKGGKPCFHATPGRIAEMEAKGYLTSDEAQAWREANGHAH